ncbi:MAG: type II CAAX endopeptidase family protein [bacterium]|nr:type II CAAX endopeptidase family protein [bacterium]
MKESHGVRNYVITTYLVFWAMVLVICGGASMVFNAPPIVMRILSDICAWSPTIVLMIMWTRLREELTRKAFLRECFRAKVKVLPLVLPAAIVAAGSIFAVWMLAMFQGNNFSTYFSMGGYSFMASFLLSILSGPTGEEAGWRGYLRVELNKKYSFVRASLIQGIIWAFWHTVLWFVDSDFSGALMLPYIVANVVVMCCLAIVMNVVLEKSNNLIYSICIHFAFNFVYCFLVVDIWFYLFLSIVYVAIALAFLYYRKSRR